MKRCTYCGNEYEDQVEVCPTDGKPLQLVGALPTAPPADVRGNTIPAAELSFWERMTFRQFAILIVRLQAVWLLFYAAVDATYLPQYVNRSSLFSSYSSLSSSARLAFFLLLLRIVMHIAAAFALIQNAERFLGWLIKDLISVPPSRPSDAKADEINL